GLPFTVRMLYVRHNGITTYGLFLVASQDQFDALNQKTFTPMLQTFAFGNNPA
nr:hypothetical protein [Ktedonobacterales bacterium]